ncbi:sterol desaturase family protein [Sphingopyxis indica]|uniref:Sterol desaturase/sphingolipid hydroxylase, fatty acid hydroxylase superfamily n=1 Tax=Sphingopyxis indica TaxID=436663 RepID=A0A239GGV4_9SPHN|nr:sterol desaturase family protein [Sphingopyxis indica]WOF44037.1 sterol desaturase family protein [Sphingopyxis indica]SNS68115.1 Sterol desaturase/sphingolipid hydroxylase, fatty acid hydroxylase superfamily [Sphingopyxis indica]
MHLTSAQSSLIVAGIYLVFCLIEILRTQFFAKPEQSRHDAIVEIVSMFALLAVTQPAILLAVGALGHAFFPAWEGALVDTPWYAALALFLVCEDMAQYWWHRASHSTPWLYNLHRAHHNARYMSVRLVYRNNIIYYAMMPNLWTAGVLVYLGLGWFYAFYLIVKMAVIIGAHSDVAWDAPLYRIKALAPVMWVVERTISTPATHHAHHGRHASDPAVNYKGNYGNLLFFWDVLFGTAKITRRFPESYGVEDLPPATLGQQLLWPIFPENKDVNAVIPGAAPVASASQRAAAEPA